MYDIIKRWHLHSSDKTNQIYKYIPISSNGYKYIDLMMT